ncbi:hypothetical protein QBC39DRAFT_353931 [Podospora conica]|nr:hypothetical protein QBC39DRAFT_353931 [Schizothecium conicum]
MEGATAANTNAGQPRGDSNRGRGRGRGGQRNRGQGEGNRGQGEGNRGGGRTRGRGGGGGGNRQAPNTGPANANDADKPAQPPAPSVPKAKEGEQEEDDDTEVCFICANPIEHLSVAPCNHSTCHICSLRLRGLYKNKECPHCRTNAPYVIFTDDASKKYEDYQGRDVTSTDENIGIRYTSEEIVGDTVLLLRYNCPESSCDFAGLGWPDLHRHVRSVHHKKMCDLCTRNKKVFTHEHDMYTDKELGDHMKLGDAKQGNDTGFRGHPLCGFCGERFYDSDKLFEHCRDKHERCFICDRRDSRVPHYYRNYNELELHFKSDHFICNDKQCMEKKFVVFESEVDLKGHQLTEHSSSLPKEARRDARTVDMSNFAFRQPYQEERRGGGSGSGSRRDEQRRRRPDPNSEPLPASSAQPLRRDELAFQRQMALNSAQASTSAPPSRPGSTPAASRVTSGPYAPPSRAPPTQSRGEDVAPRVPEVSPLTPAQRESLPRHAAVIERARNLLNGNPTKMATFRNHISTYNEGSQTSDQLVENLFTLFSESSHHALGTLVRELAELFENKEKAEQLRKSWQNRRAVTEDYPSLPTLGGMRGATTASSGWAAAATATPGGIRGVTPNPAPQDRHTNRVLKLKNSTRLGASPGGTASPATRRVVGSNDDYTPSWASSSSSNAFPSLPGPGKGKEPSTSQPSWTASGSSAAPTPSRSTAPPPPGAYSGASKRAGGAAGLGGKAPALSSADAFPELPAAPKPQTTIFGYGRGMVRRDGFGARDTGFSWNGGRGEAGPSGSGGGSDLHEAEDGAGGGGGKGKKGKKAKVVRIM